MYPSETALLPVSVTLARFVQEHGIAAFNQWFNLWYAGVPFRVITEPLVPLLHAAGQKLMPNMSLFYVSIVFVVVALFLSFLGWTLVGRLLKEKNNDFSILTFLVLTLLLPWKYLDALSLSMLSVTVSRAITPFLLISYWYVLNTPASRADLTARRILAVVVTSVMLLTSVSSIPVLIIALVSVAMAHAYEDGSFTDIVSRVKNLAGILLVSFIVVTMWYTPEYWMVVLGNPTLGGLGVGEMVSRIFELARSSLPLVLAVITVGFRKKFTSKLRVFIAVWTGTFFFITFFRFVADYDFWMDWSAWFVELEIGFALLLSTVRLRKRLDLVGIAVGIPVFVSLFIYRALGSPLLLESKLNDAVVNSYDMVSSVENSRVFVSGSDTFWLNAYESIPQLRGGRDGFALHPLANDASYQLREGKSSELAKLWIDIFGIDTVLVHTSRSENYYHDFKYTSKWDEIATRISEREGDVLYTVDNQSLAWSVSSGILEAKLPEKGDDIEALRAYLSFRNEPLLIEQISNSEYHLQIDEPGYVQALITYHRKWNAYTAEGGKLEITRDPFGFMIIDTPSDGEIKLIFDK